jgi:hypothetical protein
MSEPKDFPIHNLISILKLSVDYKNLSLSPDHLVRKDKALLEWVKDVDERLCAFEAAIANMGPSIRKDDSISYEDYHPTGK